MNRHERLEKLEARAPKKLCIFYRQSVGMTAQQLKEVAQAEAEGIPVHIVCFTRAPTHAPPDNG